MKNSMREFKLMALAIFEFRRNKMRKTEAPSGQQAIQKEKSEIVKSKIARQSRKRHLLP